MIINDLDFGGGHPFPAPQLGQAIGNALVEGSRTIVWPRGRTVEKQDVSFWATAWQGAGGQSAGSYLALRYLLRQLEQLAGNPDLQPCFIQWAGTGQSGQYNVSTPHDGWYVIENVQPDYENFVVGGLVKVRLTAQHVAPASPSSLAVSYAGGALSSSFSGAATPLIGFPIGSSAQAPTALSRTGGEGAIPLSLAPTPNPVPFVRPGSIAGLWTGGVRVYDTINTGSNPVPTGGTFVNANWVQVYGTQHDFTGDLVVTNGLLLLLIQTGQTNVASAYLWNVLLGTPAWQLQGTIEYQDDAGNSGTLREINLEHVGLEEARIRLRAGTSAGNWAQVDWKLQRGQYAATVRFTPLTQPNTSQQGLLWRLSAAAKLAFSENGVVDLATSAGAAVAAASVQGFGAVLATAANSPIVGWLYQAPPSSSEPGTLSSTVIGTGDASGPAVATFRTYGIFAVPFTATPGNFQAEGEGGTLGTGWSSVADAAASAGNAAKCASGTASGNADLFGTSWVPPFGFYRVFVRLRVASTASSTAQMQIGLWDATLGAFDSSATLAPNSGGVATSYAWILLVSDIPASGHNMRFRAVTTATTTTDWFIDEMFLDPIASNPTLGLGNFPGDIWSQWLYDKAVRWARG